MTTVLVLALSGCAGLRFYDTPGDAGGPPRRNDLVSFSETEPGVVVAYGGDCSVSVTMVSLPGQRRWVRLKSGYGSNKLSVAFGAGGTLSTVGQETDTKVPETITAIGGALKNASDAGLLALALGKEPPKTDAAACRAHAQVYRVTGGVIGRPVADFVATYVAKPPAPPAVPPRQPAAEATDVVEECRRAVAGGPVKAPTPAVAVAFVDECRRILAMAKP